MRLPKSLFVVVLGCLLAFASACRSDDASSSATSDASPRYVTTIAPFAMILEPVVAGRGTVVRLLDPGASPHTHDLRPSDVRAAEGAAAVVYGAASLDAWAAQVPAARTWALVPMLPDTARLAFDAPTGVPQADADAASTETHRGHDHGAVDPHFWTDPIAVKAVLPALVDSLCAADAAGCGTYRANADAFATRLNALDVRVQAMLAPVRDVPVMTAQPFFGYFLHRYGPSLRGVIEPQPAREPSPRQIEARVATARQASVRAIFTQRQLPPRAAEAVSEAAGIPLYALDPIGGVDGRDTYVDFVLYNAAVLRDALAQ